MIDLEEERKGFEDWHLSKHSESVNWWDDAPASWIHNDRWEGWISCAKSKQAEIDSLKAQLAKIESGEFVVVSKVDLMTVIGNCSDAMIDETTSSVFDKTGEPSTWYDHHIIAENKILSVIEAAQENSHE